MKLRGLSHLIFLGGVFISSNRKLIPYYLNTLLDPSLEEGGSVMLFFYGEQYICVTDIAFAHEIRCNEII